MPVPRMAGYSAPACTQPSARPGSSQTWIQPYSKLGRLRECSVRAADSGSAAFTKRPSSRAGPELHVTNCITDFFAAS